MKIICRLFPLFLSVVSINIQGYAQTNPIITSWLQNTTKTGSYYVPEIRPRYQMVFW